MSRWSVHGIPGRLRRGLRTEPSAAGATAGPRAHEPRTDEPRTDAPRAGWPVALRDAEDDRALRRDGYVVVDLLEPSELASLLALCRQLHPAPGAPWESDFYSPDPAVKRTVHEAIGAAFARGIDARFADHRSVIHNFVLNWPGPGGGLVLHQHSSLVDEQRFRSYVVWCALTPADEANGTLHVVPRSHRVQVGPRPERSATWSEPHTEAILRDHLVAVALQPGQAIVFDNQLLHCSFANATEQPRLSAAGLVVPRSAQLRYYEASGHDTVRSYALDPAFFVDNVAGDLEWAKPSGLPLLDEEGWAPITVDEADLAALLPQGTCSHAS